ncbi:MAG TPA: hypothetical protein VKE96_06765 [Vicinamibacterales bacterium]|nr:hypothetical protein [Vicinamibacterales bacterium]
MEPAPNRLKKTTCAEFLKAHWEVLAATDFFTVDVWTGCDLTRFGVLFIIDLSTRRIHSAGIASEPDSAWMSQISRNLTTPDFGSPDVQECPAAPSPMLLDAGTAHPTGPLLAARFGGDDGRKDFGSISFQYAAGAKEIPEGRYCVELSRHGSGNRTTLGLRDVHRLRTLLE